MCRHIDKTTEEKTLSRMLSYTDYMLKEHNNRTYDRFGI